MDSCSAVVLIILHLCGYYIIHINVLNTILSNILCIYIYICSIKKKEGGVRFVTLRGFSMGRVSGRRARFYNVAGGSPYLPDEVCTMYRRAHSCRQAATSGNVDFGLLFHL